MTDSRPFAHLHCHTTYTVMDGLIRPDELIAKVRHNGMNAVAITDTGNMSGCPQFYNLCKANDVNPIIGLEASVRRITPRGESNAGLQQDSTDSLTLLAMNRTGYRNLIRLTSLSGAVTRRGEPSITKAMLKKHSDGIVCLSGFLSGELSRQLLSNRHDDVDQLVAWYSRVFGDRFYVEIQNAAIPSHAQCLEATVDVANRMGLPLVATNDAHYLSREDADAYSVLRCIKMDQLLPEDGSLERETGELHVRTTDEMYAAFPGREDAVARSQEIADRCDLQLEESPKHYPVCMSPAETSDSQQLRKLCESAIPALYPDGFSADDRARFERELGLIDRMGQSGCFLTVRDIVRFAADNDIMYSARGVWVGSLVTYLLGISSACPIQHDLLYEPFVTGTGDESPEFNVDVCVDGLQRVYDYIQEKHGSDKVCRTGTFGITRARSAIRDVSRTLGLPDERVKELTAMIPFRPGITVADAVRENDRLQKTIQHDASASTMLRISSRIEGAIYGIGQHAVSITIGSMPLADRIPLQTIADDKTIVTQWDRQHVAMDGFLNVNLFGNRGLMVLRETLKNIKQMTGEFLDPVTIPLDDPETLSLFRRGETNGIFQFESRRIRELLTRLMPERFSDIVAITALHSPGALDAGLVDDFLDFKYGQRQRPEIHPVVDGILNETYGIVVYQEQLIQILHRIGSLPFRDAGQCVQAIRDGNLPDIAMIKQRFLSGAGNGDIDPSMAEKLFSLVEHSAGTAVGRASAKSYGLLSWRTAYLKTHYPTEFTAALPNCLSHNIERCSEAIDDARKRGIEVVTPTAIRPDKEFTVQRQDDGGKRVV